MYANIDDFDRSAHQHGRYRQALEHLYNRLDYEKLDPSSYTTIPRDLDNFREFLKEIGNPQDEIPLIHVTGTRGKGSFVIALESILRQAGYKTGATISPHLQDVRERIRIDGECLSPDHFAENYHELVPVIDKRINGTHYRTVFELITALAFHSFRKAAVDFAIVEVGLGARLDATNVITPVLSAITSISLDHTKVLGNTIAEIAADKAHIIKHGIPVVVSQQPGEARREILVRAANVGSPVSIFPDHARITNIRVKWEGTEFDLETKKQVYKRLQVSLVGRHQADNCALAVLAAEQLVSLGLATISENQIRTALSELVWPGRGEILNTNPIIVLDGAHSPQGANAVNRLVKDLWKNRSYIYILGFNKDKDVSPFLDCLEHAPKIVIATSAHTPRAMPVDQLAALTRSRGWKTMECPVEQTLDLALKIAADDDMLLVTGSFYIVGEIRNQLQDADLLQPISKPTLERG